MYYVKKINRKALKLGIFGDSFVGKTCIVNSFLNLEFHHEMIATIGAEERGAKLKLNNGSDIKLFFFDSGGTERFHRISITMVKRVQGGIIVFDVTSKNSFKNLSIWLDSIYEINPSFDLIVFGNKADIDKSRWEVTNEEINKFIEENHLKYFEVSAKNRMGINDGIEYIANELCEKEYIVIPPKK